MIFRDDLAFWDENHVQDHGKVFLLDEEDYETLQIFFDNEAFPYNSTDPRTNTEVYRNETCIVDAREVVHLGILPMSKAMDKYIEVENGYRAS